jgi:L-2,4-diaminobutyric acid acetyltransferase
MMQQQFTIRELQAADGAKIWHLVRTSGCLDLNSAYCYMMLGEYFSSSCAVAAEGEELIGAVTGFRVPNQPDTWFVWQIAVKERARGQGIAKAMLHYVLDRPENADIRYIEATISPSNTVSRRLFQGLAQERGASCEIRLAFASEWFPNGDHEEEWTYRIGPLTK